MSEWLLDTREQACHQCGREYKSISQHWSRSQNCEERSFSEDLHDTVRGILLGDGSLEGSDKPSLAVSSMRERHIRWLHEQLGWLSRGVTRESRGEYRVRTMGHSELGGYLVFQGVPSTGWTLTQTAARIWFACDGALSFSSDGSRPQITFAATDDDRRGALAQLLRGAGFSPVEWDRRVGLPRSESSHWLMFVHPPTPGSEHKWAASKPMYDSMRSGELDLRESPEVNLYRLAEMERRDYIATEHIGQSYAEQARTRGVSPSAVQVNVENAKQKLNEWFSDDAVRND